MPGGVALLDYNNDGLLDIFLVNGGRVTSPMATPENFDRHDPRYWNRLYRQNKDGSFTDVTQQAGLANAGDGNYGMGVAVGDYDNDGYPDVYKRQVAAAGLRALFTRAEVGQGHVGVCNHSSRSVVDLSLIHIYTARTGS